MEASRLPFQITRLRVKNYRSLADLDVRLGPLTAFVGRNSVGKSAIVDVLRFVKDALTLGLDAAIINRGGIAAIRRWTPRGRPADVHLTLDLSADVPHDPFSEDPRLITVSGTFACVLRSEAGGGYLVSKEELILHRPSETVVYRLAEGRLVRADSDAPVVLTDSKRLALRWVREQFAYIFSARLAELACYEMYPNSLRAPQRPADASVLDESGANLASVLRIMGDSDRKRITDALSHAVPGITGVTVTPTGSYLIVQLKRSGHLKNAPFDLGQESDGTIRLLALLTALYQRPLPSLIAIEEPELTVHPGALGVLCDVLTEASHRTQVVVTSHSPDLLYRFDPDDIRVVDRKASGSTVVGPLARHQQDAIREQLFTPGELMRTEGLLREGAEA